MTQILVLYYSKSGNTKKLAESIAQGASEVEKVRVVMKSAMNVNKNDFTQSDGIIAGSPVYFGTMAAELKSVFDRFIEIRRQMENKIGAAFTTSGDASGGKETTIFSIIQAMLIYGMIIIGDPMHATGHYGIACVGSPDEKAIKHGAFLGKRTAEIAKYIHNCQID
jgi:NAD(P)H dehydrogenase (quinone)